MFENMEINFSYYIDKKKISVTFNDNFSNDDFKAIVNFEKFNSYKKIKVSIVPNRELVIEKLCISTNYSFKEHDMVFVNGYQSWTDSREFFIDEKLSTISKLATPIIKKYQFDKYGDYTFKKYSRKSGEFHGYTYSYIRNGESINFIGSLTEKNGYTIIQQFAKNNKIIIDKDCTGHSINSEYVPFELVSIDGTENNVFDLYFDLMNIKKPKAKPMTGWTSWYNYYQNINEDIIIENLNHFKDFDKNIEIFQIDDGYQTYVGDWLDIDLSKFPRGMKYISDAIKTKGYKSGIWLAPFVCETNSKIFKEKPHWILKDSHGELVLGGSNWSRFYALDIYNPEVREYIKNVFSVVLDEWGYDMVKLDFLYAVCLVPSKTKTRGQIMTQAMEFLRECVGDKLILGCGVPLGPSFGLVDYCRIGCDVGLDWNDKAFMRMLHRERISTLNAIRNAIGRRQLNGRAFLNDPDVFLLREDNIILTETQRQTLSTVNHIFGSLLFTSDNIIKYNSKNHLIFDNIMDLKEKKIHNVESFRNGLVEVVYSQGESKYLAIINLKNKSISYDNNKFSELKELYFYKENQDTIMENTLKLHPYESRVFTIKGD
ncbi:glycoside hydrolase family 36 protein [Clostridium lacusfryxellense]|uniref:glycoside hydrolase family 36 protein n=1 Tax=Clostridium lacusfryxellense TaxID=205328 RepID=UPI001C0C9E0B|nr:glycoside hydrolase family 36 protein [Clostridium lacusfryxellense]MBU3110130.1 alpha-galactosidase [Clostridium lacusfryxellense]